MKDIILRKLREKYPETRFKLKEDPYFISVLFDNKELMLNEEFYDFAIDLADKFLEEEDKDKFALVYDYLNEIDTASNQHCEKLNYFNSTIQAKTETKIDYDEIIYFENFNEIVLPYFAVSYKSPGRREKDTIVMGSSKPNFKFIGKFNNTTIDKISNRPTFSPLGNVFEFNYGNSLQDVFSLEF